MSLEDYISNRFKATSEALVASLAEDFGYSRPDPLAGLNMLQWADKEAREQGINPELVRALIHVESAGELFAISPKGALGPMQVMPSNAKFCGLKVAELFDERKNIKCGVKILKENLKNQGWNPVRAVQEYNGGGKCVGKCEESIKHSELVMKRLARGK